MAEEIPQWLDSVGLGQYAQTFADNGIDIEALPYLRDEDFERLGVSLGHMRRLQAAIETLSADEPPTRPAAPPGKEPEPRPAEAERRQLTVMFVDLVGSTALSQQLDPEDLRGVMRRYQDAVAGAITKYEGYVAKFLGDGVLAYFGWPQAYEDQAERAVRAGLDAVVAVNDIQDTDESALEARVGIATGEVVVGDLVGESGRDADAVSGETPNLAARLQQIAAPGEVVIGDATRRLVGQTFVIDDLGSQELKGFNAAVPAWRIVGEVVAESRFEAAHGASLTRLVGRETELQLLLDRWQLAEGGEGQAVLISGEAGIGKSRLMQGLRDQVAERDHIRIRYQCSSYHTNSALYPTIQHLERAAGFAPDDEGEYKLDKLEALLRQTCDDIEADAPLFANLLSLPYEARYGALDQPPQQIKERMLEALVAQLLRLAERSPVLFLFEDTHWIDPSSQELLEPVIGRLQQTRVLLVITHRPEWQSPFTGHNHVTSLQLNRLGKAQGAELVRAIAGDYASNDVVERIVSRADGIPLFIEELTKSLVESGLDVAEADIPATLQASLLARLDRLPIDKEVAQIAACIGREFSHELLTAAAEKPDAALQSTLDRLVASGLVFKRGTPPEASYLFKHALIRDAAYDSLLRKQHEQLHARIAKVLEERFPDVVATQPELIAHHLAEGGQSARAIEFWMAAAHQALPRAAYREAVTFLDHGLAAADAQADSPDMLAAAVDLRFLKYAAQFPLGEPQLLIKILAEAERKAFELNDPIRLCRVLSSQSYVLASAGQVDDAIAVGQRGAALITENDDPHWFVMAKFMLARALYSAGRYAEAIHQVTDTMDLLGEDVERGKRFPGFLNQTVSARAWLVLFHAERGDFEAGERNGEDGLRLARSALCGDHERVWVRNAIGRLNVVKGDFGTTIETLEPVLAVCESKYPVYFPRVASSLGAAYAASGQVERSVKLLRQAEDQARSMSFEFGRALVLAQLAEALLTAGDIAEAREKATEAIEIASDAGERGNEGWVRCALGEVAYRSGQREDAEARYRQALEIAEALEMAPLQARCVDGLRRCTN